MSGKVTLRVRHEGGQGVVRGLDSGDSVEKLLTHAVESLGLPDLASLDNIKMLSGFPPKALNLSERDKSISSIGVQSGDTIILQFTTLPNTTDSMTERVFGNVGKDNKPINDEISKSNDSSNISSGKSNDYSNANTGKNSNQSSLGEFGETKRLKTDPPLVEVMLRQVVPADNSCLFTAINFCMSGEVVDSAHSSFMREIIASVVSSDGDKFSEAVLGRTNSAYCHWIQGKEAWGGAIEVQILAEYFQVEIGVVDTVSGSLTQFGEGLNFPTRMLLIYDGIHYDPLYQQDAQSSKTTFSSKDDKILAAAKAAAAQAKAANNYTDTAGFTLKCLVCGLRMKGEQEAQHHAKTTKHTNFSEV